MRASPPAITLALIAALSIAAISLRAGGTERVRAGAQGQPAAASGRLTHRARVDVRALPPAGSASAGEPPPPHTAPQPGTAPPDAPPGNAQATQVLDTSMGFTVLAAPPSHGTAFAGLGSTDNPVRMTPPDPQIAVGPSHVLEMVNQEGRVTARDGTNATTFDLPAFFSVQTGWSASDPKVIYDPASARFFATYWSAIDNASGTDHSELYVAVSTTSNPLNTWDEYVIPFDNDEPDYPGLGITDDKVTISFNRFNINTSAFVGVQTYVLQKSDLVSGALSVQEQHTAPDNTHFTFRPAHALSSTTTEYMVADDPGTSTQLHIWTITGTPAAANVVFTDVADPVVGAINAAPDAAQSGSTRLISTGGNRVLETIWRANKLWIAATGACSWNTQGDSVKRSCLRLIEYDTSAAGVTQDITFGAPLTFYYFPAIRTDSSGNLTVVFTRSSGTLFAEAAVAGRLATDAPNSMAGSTLLKAGERTYSPALLGNEPPYRWGDYLGAAVDPADPTVIWVVGEYAKTDASEQWGTYIGSFQYAPPATATPTPTATATSTPTPPPPTATNTPLPTSTPTPVPPTATDTPTSTATNTPLPTDTPTPVPTDTPVPPTATNTPTAAQCSAIARADVTGDGVVAIDDLGKVALWFGQTVPPAPASYDQTGDNKITIGDLGKQALVFGMHRCP